MPFINRLNTTGAVPKSEQYGLILEFQALRAELDDIRSALSATRALLVAGTVVGAGYNTTATNIGAAITATPGQTPRFTPT